MAQPTRAMALCAGLLLSLAATAADSVDGVRIVRIEEGYGSWQSRAAATRSFYSGATSDAYDFIVAFPLFQTEFAEADAGAEALGRHTTVRNAVTGLGKPLYDLGFQFGSHSRLKAFIEVGTLRSGQVPASIEGGLSIVAHEVAHQYAAHLGPPLAGRDGSHWSFFLDSNASVLYGSDWLDAGDGTYLAKTSMRRYSELDLYLMGLLAPSEVQPLTVLTPTGGTSFTVTDLPPADGTRIEAEARTLTLSEATSAVGPRVPSSADAQREFRAAFVVLVPASSPDPTPAQLEYVAAVRRAWENDFFFQTRGRAVMTTQPVDSPLAGVELPPGIETGLRFLLAAQKGTGAWTDDPATSARDTESAVRALDAFDVGVSGVASARALANTHLLSAVAPDADAASRRARALALLSGVSEDELADLADVAMGVPYSPGYRATILDTILRALALHDSGIGSPGLVEEVLARQNPDGGWSVITGGPSRVEVTALALQLLAGAERGWNVVAAASAGFEFLASHRRFDDLYVDDVDLPSLTAEVVVAQSAWGRTTELTGLTAQALLARQRADGSWGGSVHQTAQALRALRLLLTPNVRVTGADLQLSGTTAFEGDTVAADVTLRSTGYAATGTFSLQAFDSEGVPMSERVVVSSIAAGTHRTVRLTLDTTGHAGSTMLHVVADVLGELDEQDEQDNRASSVLQIQPPPAGPELYVRAGSLQATPDTIRRTGDPLRVSAVIGNAGLSGTSSTRVAVWINGTRVTDRTLALAARSVQEVVFDLLTPSAPYPATVRIVVDPENVEEELDESNNLRELALPATPSVDLRVTSAEALPAVAEQGMDVAVTALVWNSGTVEAFGAAVSARVIAADGAVVATLDPATVDVLAGSFQQVWLRWRASHPGTFTVRVDARHAAELFPGDEVDVATLQVTAATRPNLRMAAGDLRTVPEVVLEGKPARVIATVQNVGQGASSFDVELTTGPSHAPSRLALIPVSSLAAGASVELEAEFTPPSSAALVLRADVDPGNDVEEFDESDNTSVVTVEPLSLPDLAVAEEDIVPSNLFPKPDQDVTVTVSVRNVGRQDAAAAQLDLFLGDPATGGVLIGRRPLPAIPGLGQADVSFEWNTGEQTGAVTLVTRVALPSGAADGNHLNNQAARSLLVQTGAVAVTEAVFSPNGDGVKDTTTIAFPITAADGAVVRVLGRAGKLVREFTVEPGISFGTIEWDGMDGRGRVPEDADYILKVVAPGPAGKELGSAVVSLDTDRFPLEDVTDAALLRSLHLTSLTNLPPDYVTPPVLAPDDSGFYYFRQHNWYYPNICGFYFQPLSNEPPRLVTASDGVWCQGRPIAMRTEDAFAIAPDGSRAYFVAYIGEFYASSLGGYAPRYALESVDLTTGAVSTLLEGPAEVTTDALGSIPPRLSVDGRELYYTSGTYWYRPYVNDVPVREHRINVLSLDSNVSRRVVEVPFDIPFTGNPFSVSPDQTHITMTCWVDSGCIRIAQPGNPQTSNLYGWVSYNDRRFWTIDSRIAAARSVPPSSRVTVALIDPSSLAISPLVEVENNSFQPAPSPVTETLLTVSSDSRAGRSSIGLIRGFDAPSFTANWVELPVPFVRRPEFSPSGALVFADYQKADGSWARWIRRSYANLATQISVSRPPGAAGVTFRGTAADLHFASYELTVRAAGSDGAGTLIKRRTSRVVEDVLGTWTPPTAGTYDVTLTVRDLAGNIRRRSARFGWSGTATLANLTASPEFISPNGDGTQDEAQLRYDVSRPLTTRFSISSATGAQVLTVDRTHTEAGSFALAWDGRDSDGNQVGEGSYLVSAEKASTTVVVDRTKPALTLESGSLPVPNAPRVLQGALNPTIVYEGNVNRVFARREDGSALLVPTVSLWTTQQATDANPVSWQVEAGAGSTFQARERGTTTEAAARSYPAHFFRSNALRMSATDAAGNAQLTSPFTPPEELFVVAVGAADLLPSGERLDLDGYSIPRIDLLSPIARRLVEGGTAVLQPEWFKFTPQRYAFALTSTIREPIVRYELALETPWGVSEQEVSVLADHTIVWDARGIGPGLDFATRIRAIDANGRVFEDRIRFRGAVSFGGCVSGHKVSVLVPVPIGAGRLGNAFIDLYPSSNASVPEVSFPLAGGAEEDGEYRYGISTSIASLAECSYVAVLRGTYENGTPAFGSAGIDVCGVELSTGHADGTTLTLSVWETLKTPITSVDVYTRNAATDPWLLVGTQPGFEDEVEVRLPYSSCASEVRLVTHGTRSIDTSSPPIKYCSTPGPATCLRLAVSAARVGTAPRCGDPVPVFRVGATASALDEVTWKGLGLEILPLGLDRPVLSLMPPLDVQPTTLSTSAEVDTSQLLEGVYDVRATAETLPTGTFVQRGGRLYADRTPPVLAISAPADGAQLCAVRVQRPDGTFEQRFDVVGALTDDWLESAELRLSSFGDTPAHDQHLALASVANPRRVARTGTLGTFKGPLAPGTYRLDGEARDASGGSFCLPSRTVHVLDPVAIASLTTSAAAFSPDGDGKQDDIRVAFELDAPATIELFAGEALVHSGAAPAGAGAVMWNGRVGGGTPVEGPTTLRLVAADRCGAKTERTATVSIDLSAPVVVLSGPSSGASVAATLQLDGSVLDSNLDGYEVHLGEGSSPTEWELVASGTANRNGVLASVSLAGRSGPQVVRVRAWDRVGHETVRERPFNVTPPELLAGVSVSPNLFSPNGDGRREDATLRVQVGASATLVAHILDSALNPVGVLTLESPSQGDQTVALASAFAQLPDGDYSIEVVATASGGTTESARVSVGVDRVIEVAALDAPAQAGFVTRSAPVIGTVADTRLQTWTVQVAGREIAAGQQPVSGELARLEGLADGPNELVLTVTDSAENRAELRREVTVDTSAPQVRFSAPLAGAFLGSASTEVTRAVIEEPHPRDAKLVLVRDGVTVEVSSVGAMSGEVTASWSAAGIPEGPATLVWSAFDKAGNEGTASIPVTIDTTPPVARIDAPRGGLLATNPAFSGVAQDAHLSEWVLSLAPEGSSDFGTIASGRGSVSGPLGTPWVTPPDGRYVARLSVTERSGRKVTDEVTFQIDATPPEPATALVARALTQRRVELTWVQSTSDDVYGYQVSRALGAGALKELGAVTASSPLTDVVPTDGEYRYVVTAVDAAGNRAAPSNEASVRVDGTAPFVSILTPPDDSWISGLVDVTGIASAVNDFREYRLTRSAPSGASPFAPVASGPAPVVRGLLGTLDTTTLLQDASYVLRLEAEDLEGNVGRVDVSVSIDNVAPATPVLLTAQEKTGTMDVVLAWSQSFEADVAGYLLLRNGVPVNAPAGAESIDVSALLLPPVITTYTHVAVPDGKAAYQVITYDRAGNASAPSNTLELNLDRRAPALRIVTPEPLVLISGAFTVTGQVDDDDLTAAQFEMRTSAAAAFVAVGPVLSEPPYTVVVDPGEAKAVEVRLTGRDLAGRTGASKPVGVLRDFPLTAPSIAVTVQERSATVRWTDSNDPAAVAGYRVTAAGVDLAPVPPRPPGTATATATASGTAAGAYDGNTYSGSWTPPSTGTHTWTLELASPNLVTVIEPFFYGPPPQLAVKTAGFWFDVAAGVLPRPMMLEGVRYTYVNATGVALREVVLTPARLATSSPLADPQLLSGARLYGVEAYGRNGARAAASVTASSYTVGFGAQSSWTESSPVTVSGWGAPPASTVEFLRGGLVVATVTADASGYFAAQLPLLAGQNAFTARARYANDSYTRLTSPVYVTYAQPPAVTIALGLTSQQAATAAFSFTVTGDESSIKDLVVFRVRPGDAQPSPLKTLAAVERTFTDVDLPDGTYRYVVRARSAYGTYSPPSNEISVEITSPSLPAPTLTAVAAVGGGRVDLEWSEVSGAADYLVSRAVAEAGPYVPLATLSVPPYVDRAVLDGTTYWYRVAARDRLTNVGLVSNTVSARPVEAVPPAPPLITAPTTAGKPLTVTADTTDVRGLTEAYATVELYRNGALVSAVQAGLSETLREPLALPRSASTLLDADLSADGRIVASTHSTYSGYVLAIDDLASETSTTFVRSSLYFLGAPSLSPDGTKVAVRALDLNSFTASLYLADVSSSVLRQVTGPSGAYPWYLSSPRPSWSPDSKQVAYALIGSPSGVFVVDWDGGTEREIATRTATSLGAPWFVAADRLVTVDSSSGSSAVVELTLGTTVAERVLHEAWGTFGTHVSALSPARDRLAFTTVAYGTTELAVLDLATLAVTRATYGASNPAAVTFSPDGSRLAYLDGGLRVVQLSDRAVTQGGGIPATALLWTEAGLFGLQSGSAPEALSIGAPFVFPDVSLLAGVNRFVAIAIDGSQNRGAGSQPIEVLREAPALPELRPSVAFVPASPVVGSAVSATLTIENTSEVAAAAFVVDASLKRPDGSDLLFAQRSVAGLEPGGAVQHLIPLTGEAGPGTYVLTVRVNPDHAVTEHDHTDDTVVVSFSPSVSPQLSLAAVLTPSTIDPGVTSTLTVTSTNPAGARSGLLTIDVQDASGGTVRTLVEARATTVTGGVNVVATAVVDLQGLLAGSYAVSARLLDGGATLAAASSVLVYRPEDAVELSVEPTRATFRPDDEITAVAAITNASRNALLTSAELVLEIAAADGSLPKQLRYDLPLLTNGATETRTLRIGALPAGDYTVQGTVRRGSILLATSSASFRVIGAARLTGLIAVSGATSDPPNIRAGTPLQLAYSVANGGTARSDATAAKVAIVDPTTGALVAERDVAVAALAPGEATAGAVAFETVGWPLATYRVALVVEEVVATTRVRIADGTAPSLIVTAPMNEAFVKNGVIVSAEVRDAASGVVAVRATLDGVATYALARVSGVPTDGLWSGDLPLSVDGVHTLAIVAEDAEGNMATAATRTITRDSAAPGIVIEGVAAGDVSTTPVTPVIRFEDAHLASTSLTVNGVAFTSGEPVSADGTYELVARAADRAGNTAHRSLQFEIDRTAPVIRVLGVSEGEVVRPPVALYVEVSDARSVGLDLRVDGATYVEGTPIELEGPHVVTVRAEDAAGLVSELELRFTLDATPPTIDVTGVEQGAYVTSQVELSFTAEDLHLGDVVATLDAARVESGVRVGDGDHAFVVDAFDRAGNRAAVSYTFTVDATPPVIEVQGVVDGSYSAEDVSPRIEIRDDHLRASSVLLDGAPFTSGASVHGEGPHLLEVKAVDDGGLETVVTRTFTIDRTAPEIVISGVTEGQRSEGDVTPVVTFTDAALEATDLTLDGRPFSSGTTVTEEGAHLLIATAEDRAGNRARRELGFELVRDRLTILATKTLASWPRGLALVRAGACAMDAVEFERVGDYLRAEFTRAGGMVTTVADEESFRRHVRSGSYNLFVLFSQAPAAGACAAPESDRGWGLVRGSNARAVTERVFSGTAGLLVVRTLTANWPHYREVSGIDSVGLVQSTRVQFVGAPFAAKGAVDVGGVHVGLKSTGGLPAAEYVPAGAGVAAATMALGEGRALTVGFDPSRLPQDDDLTQRALRWLLPAPEPPAPLGVAGVRVEGVASADAAIVATETLPPGVAVLWASAPGVIGDVQRLIDWRFDALMNQPWQLRYLARLPDAAGTYELETRFSSEERPTGDPLRLAVTVQRDGFGQLTTARLETESLGMTGVEGAVRGRVLRALETVAQRPIRSTADIEANLDALYGALDDLKTLNVTDSNRVRHAFAPVIRYWEARWYAP